MSKFIVFSGSEDEVVAIDPAEVCAIVDTKSMFSDGRSIFLKSGKSFLVKDSLTDIYTSIGATAE